jgi:hypothetical protein
VQQASGVARLAWMIGDHFPRQSESEIVKAHPTTVVGPILAQCVSVILKRRGRECLTR